MFNRCIQVGYFAHVHKTAKIKQLFKSGDMQNPTNYRPISLLSSLSKNFGKFMVMMLESFWEISDLLNSKQYGLGKRKSTLNALNDLTERIRAKISKSEKTICTFLDLSKAFDTVSHETLLKKLEDYGARGNVLQLLVSFLKKTICTNWRKSFRNLRYKCWNTQDSVLGPLLFLIYLDDKTGTQDEISKTALFAVHCSILTSHQHNHFPAKEEQLHQISRWLSAKKLTLNLKKTFYLKFGRTKSMSKTLRKVENFRKQKAVSNFWGSSLILTWTSKTMFRTSVKNL